MLNLRLVSLFGALALCSCAEGAAKGPAVAEPVAVSTAKDLQGKHLSDVEQRWGKPEGHHTTRKGNQLYEWKQAPGGCKNYAVVGPDGLVKEAGMKC